MLLSRSIIVAALLAALTPHPADAQIYVSRLPDGSLLFSDKNVEDPIKVYGVPGAPAYLTTKPISQSASLYESLVAEHAKRTSLRPDLVRAVIQVESGFNPRARSPKGAMGLMQLMPDTARMLGVRNAFDPAENIRGGTTYLRQLLDKYEGREELALAAYNAGSGAVDRHGDIPPYRETQDYVRKVGERAGKTAAVQQASSRRVIYKWLEINNGQVVATYSSQKPKSGVTYEIVR